MSEIEKSQTEQISNTASSLSDSKELLAEQGSEKLQVQTLALSTEEKKAKVAELAAEMGINHTKLMWKLDIGVVIPFMIFYFLCFIDRVNISNAKVYGMTTDLGLTSNQFSAALTVFFVPYIFFEVLSNYILKFVKPHLWLSSMIFLFGIVTIAMAFSRNYGGLITCRLFLGIFEAGSFPSIFYIMSNFYSSHESQKRFSFFFGATCLAGGCAGALAYRIHDLDGVHGLSSWQWIFVIEGAFTAGLAFILYFLIPDFPEEARFLNANERAFLKKKLAIFAGESGFEIKQTWSDVLQVFKEPAIYICAVCYFSFIIPAYSYAFFAPTIIKDLGYVSWEAQRHSIYPWLASMGFSILVACFSDYFVHRLAFGVFACLVAAAGYIMVIVDSASTQVKYGGLFLIACGTYTAMPVLICWFALNFNGHIRKSVGTAFIIGFGNIGGIVSSFLFPTKDSPKFTMGLGVGLAFSFFGMILMVVYFFYLQYMNKQKTKLSYVQKWETLDDRAKLMAGDLNPDFKYLY